MDTDAPGEVFARLEFRIGNGPFRTILVSFLDPATGTPTYRGVGPDVVALQPGEQRLWWDHAAQLAGELAAGQLEVRDVALRIIHARVVGIASLSSDTKTATLLQAGTVGQQPASITSADVSRRDPSDGGSPIIVAARLTDFGDRRDQNETRVTYQLAYRVDGQTFLELNRFDFASVDVQNPTNPNEPFVWDVTLIVDVSPTAGSAPIPFGTYDSLEFRLTQTETYGGARSVPAGQRTSFAIASLKDRQIGRDPVILVAKLPSASFSNNDSLRDRVPITYRILNRNAQPVLLELTGTWTDSARPSQQPRPMTLDRSSSIVSVSPGSSIAGSVSWDLLSDLGLGRGRLNGSGDDKTIRTEFSVEILDVNRPATVSSPLSDDVSFAAERVETHAFLPLATTRLQRFENSSFQDLRAHSLTPGEGPGGESVLFVLRPDGVREFGRVTVWQPASARPLQGLALAASDYVASASEKIVLLVPLDPKPGLASSPRCAVITEGRSNPGQRYVYEVVWQEGSGPSATRIGTTWRGLRAGGKNLPAIRFDPTQGASFAFLAHDEPVVAGGVRRVSFHLNTYIETSAGMWSVDVQTFQKEIPERAFANNTRFEPWCLPALLDSDPATTHFVLGMPGSEFGGVELLTANTIRLAGGVSLATSTLPDAPSLTEDPSIQGSNSSLLAWKLTLYDNGPSRSDNFLVLARDLDRGTSYRNQKPLHVGFDAFRLAQGSSSWAPLGDTSTLDEFQPTNQTNPAMLAPPRMETISNLFVADVTRDGEPEILAGRGNRVYGFVDGAWSPITHEEAEWDFDNAIRFPVTEGWAVDSLTDVDGDRRPDLGYVQDRDPTRPDYRFYRFARSTFSGAPTGYRSLVEKARFSKKGEAPEWERSCWRPAVFDFNRDGETEDYLFVNENIHSGSCAARNTVGEFAVRIRSASGFEVLDPANIGNELENANRTTSFWLERIFNTEKRPDGRPVAENELDVLVYSPSSGSPSVTNRVVTIGLPEDLVQTPPQVRGSIPLETPGASILYARPVASINRLPTAAKEIFAVLQNATGTRLWRLVRPTSATRYVADRELLNRDVEPGFATARLGPLDANPRTGADRIDNDRPQDVFVVAGGRLSWLSAATGHSESRQLTIGGAGESIEEIASGSFTTDTLEDLLVLTRGPGITAGVEVCRVYRLSQNPQDGFATAAPERILQLEIPTNSTIIGLAADHDKSTRCVAVLIWENLSIGGGSLRRSETVYFFANDEVRRDGRAVAPVAKISTLAFRNFLSASRRRAGYGVTHCRATNPLPPWEHASIQFADTVGDGLPRILVGTGSSPGSYGLHSSDHSVR